MSYTDVFTGDVIKPTDVSYEELDLATSQVLSWPVARINDVVSATGATYITLPDATLVSVGQDIFFNNLGANTFTVRADDGITTVATVTAGSCWYLYLADNTTANGSWQAVAIATSGSAVTAAGLQGYGVRAISTAPTVLSSAHAVSDWASTTRTTALTDRAGVINFTHSSAGALTLSNTNAEANYFFLFRNSGTANVTATPTSGTVDGAANKTITTGNSCFFIFDGTNWITVGYGQSTTFAFSAATLSLTGQTGTVAASSLSGYVAGATLITFTGTPTGNTVVTFGTSAQVYTMYNNATMGSYSLGVKTSSGSNTYTLTSAERMVLYTDGAEMYNAVSPSTIEAEAYALAMAVALG